MPKHQSKKMEGWTIVFILLCLFFGPVYVLVAVIGFAAAIAPGTSNSLPIGLLMFLLIIFAIPFIFTGYMAFFRSVGIPSAN